MPGVADTTFLIEPEHYRFLQDFVYRGSGIVVDQGKQYLFEARLTPVIRNHGLTSIADLCALLRAGGHGPVQSEVIDAMTTNETYFFREPSQYDAIRTMLLPELREQRAATRKLSFWSSAASTGQESYSLAMMLLEQGFAGWNIQILGTDLCSKVVDRARAARYLQIEMNRGLPAPLLVKYFERHGMEWQLQDRVRKMVRFEHFDLRTSMRSHGPFDLVFCRNVLVYFDVDARRKILREIHGTLFRGGWLLLGTAETTPGLDEYFERRSIGSGSAYVAR